MGYERTAKHYRVLNPSTGKVGPFSSVKFSENKRGGLYLKQLQQKSTAPLDPKLPEEELGSIVLPVLDIFENQDNLRDAEVTADPVEDNRNLRPSTPERRIRDLVSTKSDEDSPGWRGFTPAPTDPIVQATRSGRNVRPVNRHQANLALARIPPTPASFTEAKAAGPFQQQWADAIQEELASHQKQQTWELVPLKAARGRNIISTRWVFKIKQQADGSISKFKARLVARGFTQVEGLDYFETYAPVVRVESLRTMLAIAVQKNLVVH